jgi:1-aminocyclopropane-1-carboxylate deaminase
MIHYTQTPIQQINQEWVRAAGIKLFIKREDMNHPHISGNKWWKLKYNLIKATELGHKTILTFGGAYSNHIYATAAAAKQCQFKSIGIIRGEAMLLLNPTLHFAKDMGMQLHYVSREAYRMKTEYEFIKDLKNTNGDFYLIPEGGSNELAVKGCAEFGRNLINELDFDYVCLPVGTGATMAGVVAGIGNTKRVIGFSVLKGGNFLLAHVETYLLNYSDSYFSNWEINTDYHFGGYAKYTNELIDFKKQFETEYEIPLDKIYTAKMMAGIFDLIQKNYFKRGSTVLAIHTGGLQGNII